MKAWLPVKSVTLSTLLLFMTPNLPAQEGVILLHGLARSSRSMQPLAHTLESVGYHVVNVDYPSRTAPIETLAPLAISSALAHESLRHCSRIHFVTHSLGGILVRWHLAQNHIPNLGRVVMLGPPNQGSEVVDRLQHWRLFHSINGPAGQQLGTNPLHPPHTLGPVHFELGVIAGNRSINWINSLLIPGPDDGKVSVQRTHVEGLKEHLVLPVTHPFMMRDHRVIDATLRFLQHGTFQPTSS
jgi:pimeloyl-ACP methyl ester carboxylesterase